MPIQEQNIVFVESQILDDVPEGGGAATGREVVDGQMNNVFEDISDLDRAMGRFNLRKLFLAVRALNTDLYGGSKLVVTELPTDDALGYTVFTTGDAFDTRAAAVNRVEAYLFKGPMWPGALQSNHIQGMQAINVIQRVGTQIPPIGKTLCIVQNEGLGNEAEQYVRVIDVTVTDTVFEDSSGTFNRWVVRMDLSDPLLFNFNGHDANRFDSYNYTGKARLRDTTVADAQRYFGAQTLAEPAAIGDTSVRAQSQFAQLVPSARTETALVNQVMNPNLNVTISAGARTVDVPQQAHTLALDVTAENRRLNWIETLYPMPRPGTLTISFRAQGNWYTLTDDGDGVLSGSDPSNGAGTISYMLGDASVTLGALPDAGSQIMYAWASPVHYNARAGHSDIDTTITVQHHLDDTIKPGTLTLTWLSNSVTRTATANAAGVISGDGAGGVDHTTGEFWLTLNATPDPGSQLGIDYERETQVLKTFTGVTLTGGYASVDVEEAVVPGSVLAEFVLQSIHQRDGYTITKRFRRIYSGASLAWVVQESTRTDKSNETKTRSYEVSLADDGDGTIGRVGGVVNYATGEMTLPVLTHFEEKVWSKELQGYVGTGYATSYGITTEFASGIVQVYYQTPGGTPTAISTEIPIPPMRFRVLPRLLDEFIVPNSVQFTWGGATYIDLAGIIYKGPSGSDPGLPVGSIDYASGWVELEFWDYATGKPNVTSLLTRFSYWTTVEASFRSASSPLAPEALSIVAVTEDGDQISASGDQDGVIQGAFIEGSVSYEFGIATVRFGSYDGETWVPRAVDPGTIKYNAVAYRYIPLPANILGVNAVRLPPDGRVPIFKSGDVVMVMHRLETAPVTPTNGVPVSLGRTRIAWVRVIDANGATVTEGYTLDREAGTVTFPDVTGLSLPLTIRHTVGDLRLVTDAQINGDLTLARELTHNYPAGESLVASCLLFGDRRARVSHLWDQVSWNGTWVDSIVGSAATATLNTIDFPVTVTNEGADTDRWIFRVVNAGANQWELISEKRGLVWSGTYAPGGADVAPINPRTRVWDEQSQAWVGGTPYMTIPGLANGGGWANGNVVRINTVGAIADFWIARSIAQSDEPAGDGLDGAEIYALGNIDRPE